MKIIVNPEAEKGKGRKVLSQIERYFQERKIDFSIALSSHPMESTELAKKA